MDRAQRRLLWALVASMLLHGWLMHAADNPGARRIRVDSGAPLSATLSLPPPDTGAPTAAQTTPRPAPTEQKLVNVEPRSNTVPAPAASEERRTVEPHPGVVAKPESVLTQPSDPTYYTARSLDSYPKALTPLQLDAQPGTLKVRATLFIDEAGNVNEVRAIEAIPATVEGAARELLLRARFTPASKDGRMVKAQVVVSLE